MERAIPRKSSRSDSGTASGSVDEYFIDRAIDLAWLGSGRTLTNPLVGCVVAKDGRVLGEGFHEAFGRDHAETVALKAAGKEANGATLYATLEPCTHRGKTPPCVDRIVASGVRRVVVCTIDPDPRMNGSGIAALERHDIQVDVGVRVERALLLNMSYLKKVLGMGQTVTLKMAMTLDGRIASRPGARDDISGPESRVHVHRLRSEHDGVLVGIETLLVDKPRLDCRTLDDVASPMPVVADARLRFPAAYRWQKEKRKFIVAAGEEADDLNAKRIEAGGGVVVRAASESGRLKLSSMLEQLRGQGLESILVEGGARLFTSFLESGVWDGLHVLISPVVFGPGSVELSRTTVDKRKLGAIFAGTSRISDDVLLSFISERTRDAMVARLS
jgi:diaminohydroxyphosphoribosylaminopyrimidine deaminase/5-amino-6-(5-phosphoribosylamino)uracil reductase